MMRGPLLPIGKRGISAAALALALAAGGISASWILADQGRAADNDDNDSVVSPPSRVTVKDGVTILTLSAAGQQNSGIETAHPMPLPAQSSVTGYGAVLDAGSLAELSNRYLDAKAQVQTADAKLAVSRAAFERATTLYKDQQNMSAAQLQSAEGSFEIDRVALAAAQSHLSAIAASAKQAWGPVIGASLVEGAPLVERLIERRDYLVKVTLPPGVAAAPSDTAAARLADGSEVQLSFVSPATTTDPRVQGAGYFYLAPAESGLLPGASIVTSLPMQEAPKGVVVPDAAVVWLQGKAWVYLRTGPETFVRREIAADHAAPGGYVASDLTADVQIAVRGAQMLLSEEFRAQIQTGDEN